MKTIGSHEKAITPCSRASACVHKKRRKNSFIREKDIRKCINWFEKYEWKLIVEL